MTLFEKLLLLLLFLHGIAASQVDFVFKKYILFMSSNSILNCHEDFRPEHALSALYWEVKSLESSVDKKYKFLLGLMLHLSKSIETSEKVTAPLKLDDGILTFISQNYGFVVDEKKALSEKYDIAVNACSSDIFEFLMYQMVQLQESVGYPMKILIARKLALRFIEWQNNDFYQLLKHILKVPYENNEIFSFAHYFVMLNDQFTASIFILLASFDDKAAFPFNDAIEALSNSPVAMKLLLHLKGKYEQSSCSTIPFKEIKEDEYFVALIIDLWNVRTVLMDFHLQFHYSHMLINVNEMGQPDKSKSKSKPFGAMEKGGIVQISNSKFITLNAADAQLIKKILKGSLMEETDSIKEVLDLFLKTLTMESICDGLFIYSIKIVHANGKESNIYKIVLEDNAAELADFAASLFKSIGLTQSSPSKALKTTKSQVYFQNKPMNASSVKSVSKPANTASAKINSVKAEKRKNQKKKAAQKQISLKAQQLLDEKKRQQQLEEEEIKEQLAKSINNLKPVAKKVTVDKKRKKCPFLEILNAIKSIDYRYACIFKRTFSAQNLYTLAISDKYAEPELLEAILQASFERSFLESFDILYCKSPSSGECFIDKIRVELNSFVDGIKNSNPSQAEKAVCFELMQICRMILMLRNPDLYHYSAVRILNTISAMKVLSYRLNDFTGILAEIRGFIDVHVAILLNSHENLIVKSIKLNEIVINEEFKGDIWNVDCAKIPTLNDENFSDADFIHQSGPSYEAMFAKFDYLKSTELKKEAKEIKLDSYFRNLSLGFNGLLYADYLLVDPNLKEVKSSMESYWIIQCIKYTTHLKRFVKNFKDEVKPLMKPFFMMLYSRFAFVKASSSRWIQGKNQFASLLLIALSSSLQGLDLTGRDTVLHLWGSCLVKLSGSVEYSAGDLSTLSTAIQMLHYEPALLQSQSFESFAFHALADIKVFLSSAQFDEFDQVSSTGGCHEKVTGIAEKHIQNGNCTASDLLKAFEEIDSKIFTGSFNFTLPATASPDLSDLVKSIPASIKYSLSAKFSYSPEDSLYLAMNSQFLPITPSFLTSIRKVFAANANHGDISVILHILHMTMPYVEGTHYRYFSYDVQNQREFFFYQEAPSFLHVDHFTIDSFLHFLNHQFGISKKSAIHVCKPEKESNLNLLLDYFKLGSELSIDDLLAGKQDVWKASIFEAYTQYYDGKLINDFIEKSLKPDVEECLVDKIFAFFLQSLTLKRDVLNNLLSLEYSSEIEASIIDYAACEMGLQLISQLSFRTASDLMQPSARHSYYKALVFFLCVSIRFTSQPDEANHETKNDLISNLIMSYKNCGKEVFDALMRKAFALSEEMLQMAAVKVFYDKIMQDPSLPFDVALKDCAIFNFQLSPQFNANEMTADFYKNPLLLPPRSQDSGDIISWYKFLSWDLIQLINGSQKIELHMSVHSLLSQLKTIDWKKELLDKAFDLSVPFEEKDQIISRIPSILTQIESVITEITPPYAIIPAFLLNIPTDDANLVDISRSFLQLQMCIMSLLKLSGKIEEFQRISKDPFTHVTGRNAAEFFLKTHVAQPFTNGIWDSLLLLHRLRFNLTCIQSKFHKLFEGIVSSGVELNRGIQIKRDACKRSKKHVLLSQLSTTESAISVQVSNGKFVTIPGSVLPFLLKALNYKQSDVSPLDANLTNYQIMSILDCLNGAYKWECEGSAFTMYYLTSGAQIILNNNSNYCVESGLMQLQLQEFLSEYGLCLQSKAFIC